MLAALGPISSALDAIQSLTSSKSSNRSTAASRSSANPFDVPASTAGSAGTPSVRKGDLSRLSPGTLGALIAAQSQASTSGSSPVKPFDAQQRLFAQVDADGDGSMSKTEFENAFGAGGTNIAQADDVFGKLDANQDGSVSLNELASALGKHRHKHGDKAETGDGGNKDIVAKMMDEIFASNANPSASAANTGSTSGEDAVRTRAGEFKLTILPNIELTRLDPTGLVNSAVNLPPV
jgi:hypothetical protein